MRFTRCLGITPATVMGLVLVAGVALPLATSTTLPDCSGHMQSTDPTQVCYDKFTAHANAAATDADALAAVGTATAGRTCYRPADLPKGVVPSWAVMRRTDGTVVGESFDKAWTEAKAGKAWTVSVCR